MLDMTFRTRTDREDIALTLLLHYMRNELAEAAILTENMNDIDVMVIQSKVSKMAYDLVCVEEIRVPTINTEHRGR